MNEPTPSTSSRPGVPPLPSATPPTALPPNPGLGVILESLLKRPAQLIDAMQLEGGGVISAWLFGAALLALGGYGLLVGTFSGGEQLLAAPLKISLGALTCVIICLPSLFIFACLTGADVTVRGVTGILAAVLALTSLLLVGFAPVAWVFSQSTESVAFIGTLHLLFWLIGLALGLRLLRIFMDLLRVRDRMHLRVWTFLFILVSLQMTTALRPIVGTASHYLPSEKKFFLEHWFDSITARRNEPAGQD